MWNKIISEYYLEINHKNEIFNLDIDEDDFIKIFKESGQFKEETKEEILYKYVLHLKPFGSNFKNNILKWNGSKEEYKLNNTPSFFQFIPVLIIPFNSGNINNKLNINNFYNILYDYWSKYNLFDIESKSLLQDYIHPDFWKSLEHWLHDIWEGTYGDFSFKEENVGTYNSYVTHFFRQVAFRKQNMKRLPKWYYTNGIIPFAYVSFNDWFQYLNDNRFIKDLSLLPSISNKLKDKDNDLTIKVINKISNHYKNWDGIVRSYHKSEEGEGEYEFTIATLKLCIKIEIRFGNDFDVSDIYFRMYSNSEIDENLRFNSDIDIFKDTDQWSSKIEALKIKFDDNIELHDSVHNWKLNYKWKYPIILQNAEIIGLKHWIEINEIIDVNRFVLIIVDIEQNFDLFDLLSLKSQARQLKDKIYIFRIKLSEIGEETLNTLKHSIRIDNSPQIILNSNLSFNNGRNFFKLIPPSFSITNSSENDEVYLQSGDEMLTLEKRIIDDITLFNIPNNTHFKDHGYQIRTDKSELVLPGSFFFKNFFIGDSGSKSEYTFDRLNNIIDNNYHNSPKIGKNFAFQNCRELEKPFIIVDEKRCLWESVVWKEYNNGKKNNRTGSKISNYNIKQNSFIEYLSSLRELSITDFKNSYFIFSKYFFPKLNEDERNENRNFYLKELNRLGFVEIDYSKRLIYINDSTIIQIPNDRGIDYLFLGCRNRDQVNELMRNFEIEGMNMKVYLKNDSKKNQAMMLPQPIFIRASHQKYKKRLCEIIHALKYQITVPNYLVQEAYIRLSENVIDFSQRVNNTQEQHPFDYPGLGYYFCRRDVKFKPVRTVRPKKFDLIKYTIEYSTPMTLFWRDKKQFEVNKDYAIFYFLKKYKKDVLLFDSMRNYIAIPATISFPFFIERGIILRSGYKPRYAFIENSPLANRRYNVYKKITKRLAKIVAKKLGQNLIEMNIKIPKYA